MAEAQANDKPVLTLNDKNYVIEDLSDQAKYCVAQIQDLDTQIGQSKARLDQLEVAVARGGRVGGVEHGSALQPRHAQLFRPRLIHHRTASPGKMVSFGEKWAIGTDLAQGTSIDGSRVSHEVPTRRLVWRGGVSRTRLSHRRE